MLFIGDIMGHDSQIAAAYDAEKKTYEYDSVFKHVAPIISEVDYAVANLEVTLAGPPYKGYPQFSSPDNLAGALKRAGVDCLVTANNHSCDRKKPGIERTIKVLDSLKMDHTGTFLSQETRDATYPLMAKRNGISVAILNYTYATNGIPAEAPNVVNLIKRDLIAADLKKAKEKNPDKIIVVMHWGMEYELQPRSNQVSLYEFCVENGADYVIGSHPHVLQKMEVHGKNLIAYSLGNFVSNQRTAPRDGGAMFRLTLGKKGDSTYLKETGYFLTWVYPPVLKGKKKFYILPCHQFEEKKSFFVHGYHAKMMAYITSMRKLLGTENKGVGEYKLVDKKWQLSH